jgi:hypothetical protein
VPLKPGRPLAFVAVATLIAIGNCNTAGMFGATSTVASSSATVGNSSARLIPIRQWGGETGQIAVGDDGSVAFAVGSAIFAGRLSQAGLLNVGGSVDRIAGLIESIAVTDDGFAYAIVEFDGLIAVDIRDLGRPVLVSRVDVDRANRALSVSGNRLLAVGEEAHVYDISDRTRPERIATLPPTEGRQGWNYAVLDDRIAYLVSSPPGLFSVNIEPFDDTLHLLLDDVSEVVVLDDYLVVRQSVETHVVEKSLSPMRQVGTLPHQSLRLMAGSHDVLCTVAWNAQVDCYRITEDGTSLFHQGWWVGSPADAALTGDRLLVSYRDAGEGGGGIQLVDLTGERLHSRVSLSDAVYSAVDVGDDRVLLGMHSLAPFSGSVALYSWRDGPRLLATLDWWQIDSEPYDIALGGNGRAYVAVADSAPNVAPFAGTVRSVRYEGDVLWEAAGSRHDTPLYRGQIAYGDEYVFVAKRDNGVEMLQDEADVLVSRGFLDLSDVDLNLVTYDTGRLAVGGPRGVSVVELDFAVQPPLYSVVGLASGYRIVDLDLLGDSVVVASSVDVYLYRKVGLDWALHGHRTLAGGIWSVALKPGYVVVAGYGYTRLLRSDASLEVLDEHKWGVIPFANISRTNQGVIVSGGEVGAIEYRIATQSVFLPTVQGGTP